MSREANATVEAFAFHPGYPEGRASGRLQITRSGACFVPEVSSLATIELPVADLTVRETGATDRVLLFEHRELPGVSLSTTDLSILASEAFLPGGPLADRARAFHREGRRIRGRWLALGVTFAVLLGVAVFSAGWLVDRAVGWIPRSVERSIGDAAWTGLRDGLTLVDDATVRREIDEIVAPLQESGALEGLDLRVHVVVDDTPNAFALPGGVVVLHTGLLDIAGNLTEVRGVLAHELAHVTERHSLRQMVEILGLALVVQTMIGDPGGLTEALADGGLRLANLGFSRDHEREADLEGWKDLVEAGVDPRGMIGIFESLELYQEESGTATGTEVEAALTFLSTHPAMGERVETLRQRAVAEDVGARTWMADGSEELERLRIAIVEAIAAQS